MATIGFFSALALSAFCALASLSGGAWAAERRDLVIVTSYPPSFIEPFQKAFESQNADIRLVVVQRNTASASRFIIEKTEVAADIFWASAADAFELLKRTGELRPIAPRATGAPDKVLGYPVDDPGGYYLGFALSAYGFVYNPSYLAQYGLPVPRDWQDLIKPIYSGHIGITSPSRSGTTHLIVEALLQTYGWDRGWALLSQLGGNLSTVTARSFGVASGVAQRRFGIGITIDFLARAPDFASADNVFIVPRDAVFVPASIAILSRARNVEGAERFVDFVLSEEGQKILLSPAVGRIPVFASLNGGLLPEESGNGLLKYHSFDPSASAARYGLVNLMFDDYIVRRRAVLARLWKRLTDLETANIDDPQRQDMLERARALLSMPPLSADEMTSLAEPLKTEWPRGAVRSPEQQAFARALRSTIEQNLAAAETLILTASRDPASMRYQPWRQ
ncbi:ABC transporter substrate-binding protein [Aminobacter carboxidus]|uniref:Extracellular solute-binding protein n=1 Tax=Aminobacter carboxidus TaxID=376165 RepID=A0ABR9GNI8_9HYPH|nr:extracellular solute-binding protein [Aminobacter carboxidus]MBE1205246.1 extracellular solute-binding protein [Aminobacter carboxidus]